MTGRKLPFPPHPSILPFHSLYLSILIILHPKFEIYLSSLLSLSPDNTSYGSHTATCDPHIVSNRKDTPAPTPRMPAPMKLTEAFDQLLERMMHQPLIHFKQERHATRALGKTLSTIKKECLANRDLRKTLSTMRAELKAMKPKKTTKAITLPPAPQAGHSRPTRRNPRMRVDPRWWGRQLAPRVVEGSPSQFFWVFGEYNSGPQA